MARCSNNNRQKWTGEETEIYPRLIRDTCPNDCNSCKPLATFPTCQVARSQLSYLFCFWFCNLFFEPCSGLLPILPPSDKTTFSNHRMKNTPNWHSFFFLPCFSLQRFRFTSRPMRSPAKQPPPTNAHAGGHPLFLSQRASAG